MKNIKIIEEKIIPFNKIEAWVKAQKLTGKTIAFTSGHFDTLHKENIYALSQAAKEADRLLVGINVNIASQKQETGNLQVNDLHTRATILASLILVDAIVLFEEDVLPDLIKKILPDALVTIDDSNINPIVGANEVIDNGGRIVITPSFKNAEQEA